MDADRWTKIDRLYHEAASLADADRVAFLDRACGEDATLKAEIESLLAEDAAAAPFLEEPALAAAARLVADEIPDLTGRMFGPYRMDALLGAGGMGDVYRVRDTVLGRDVAIKILPEAFSDDAERLTRFEQEARFLASFSHPNIAAIYGVHESDGIRGLVLELVDGETLSQRIGRGPIPLYDAARIARQIGEGLDAAHQRGVVHRDLKPSNIKIGRDGTTKILDFGLAKAAADESEPDGLVLGTASYMSPEQARGDGVDKRTDIWAFGCVTFEMLTGRPAFRGKPAAGSDAAAGTGPRWDLMPPTVPAGVITVLRRCLEPDPKRRRRDIGDVLVDLEDALRPNVETISWSSRTRWLAIAGGLLLLAFVAATMLQQRRSPEDRPSIAQARTSVLLPPGMFFPEQDNQIAVSPDGTMIAYVAAVAGEAPRLVLKKLDTGSELIVGDAYDVRDPFFSPDSKWLGFIAGDTIRKVHIADGRSQVVCRAPRAESPSWSNGLIVFGEASDLPAGGIRRVAEGGGPVEVVSNLNRAGGETHHAAPQLLPDGQTLMYTVRRAYRGVARLVVQTPGSPPKVLLDDAYFGRYIGNSVLIYQRDRSLFATTLDLTTLTVSGSGVMLFNDLSPSFRPFWGQGGGVLAYRPRNENLRFVWVTRAGVETSLPSPPRAYSAPNISPHGDSIAVDIVENGSYNVWIYDITHQGLTRLTSDGVSRYPMWTPDGGHIAIVQRRDNLVYWLAPDGSDRRELVRGTSQVWIGSWMSDMSTLIYMQENTVTHSDLWAADLRSNTPPRSLVQTTAREYGGRVSPDGRWLAYFSDESGQFELYLTALTPGARRQQVSTARAETLAGPREAVWARDGRELFYRHGAQMLSVGVPAGANLSPGKPMVLFEGEYFAAGGPGIVNNDVTPDGRFLMLKPFEDRSPHLSVVQGLDRLIRERVPSER